MISVEFIHIPEVSGPNHDLLEYMDRMGYSMRARILLKANFGDYIFIKKGFKEELSLGDIYKSDVMSSL